MGMERKVLIIDGMTCINCQNKIEQELKNTAGISKVQVSYSKGQAEIEFNPEIVTLNRIAAIIEKLDYTVIDKKQADSLKWVRRIGTLARGYAKSRQITVLITDNFSASHRALECSAVAIARILSNVNAPLLSVRP